MSLMINAPQLRFLMKNRIEINVSGESVKLPEAPHGLERMTQHGRHGFMPLGAYSYSHGYSAEFKRIGRYCSIGENVSVFKNTHPSDRASTSPVFYAPRRFGKWGGDASMRHHLVPFVEDGIGVTVGNDVWIGGDTAFKDGVTIGDGAIIAYRSVVTQDVPAYSIVAGTPARVLRPRFEDAGLADALLRLQWWRFAVSDLMEMSPEQPEVFARNLEDALSRGVMTELPEDRVTVRQLLKQFRQSELPE